MDTRVILKFKLYLISIKELNIIIKREYLSK